MLNREICAGYNRWSQAQIWEREEKLLACFHEIWPPAEHFIGNTSEPKVEPKAEPQEVTFVTYAGIANLSGIETRRDEVIGVDHHNNRQALEKSNILFVCSATAWPEVEPHIHPRPKVQRQKLRSPQYQKERLDLEDRLLKSAQEEQFEVTSITRSGDELKGTIEDFDKDEIYMQIREHTITVYRHGIYEFATDEWSQGRVVQFDSAQGRGAILSNESVRCSVHINEVSDKNIRELKLGQQVEFNINQTTEGSVAINVKLVEE